MKNVLGLSYLSVNAPHGSAGWSRGRSSARSPPSVFVTRCCTSLSCHAEGEKCGHPFSLSRNRNFGARQSAGGWNFLPLICTCKHTRCPRFAYAALHLKLFHVPEWLHWVALQGPSCKIVSLFFCMGRSGLVHLSEATVFLTVALQLLEFLSSKLACNLLDQAIVSHATPRMRTQKVVDLTHAYSFYT